MGDAITAKPISWQLLAIVYYSLVLQKLASFLKRHRKLSLGLSFGLVGLALAALVVGSYGSYRAWRYDHHQQVAIQRQITKSNKQFIKSNKQAAALAPSSVPSTTTPGYSALDSYTVAPSLPRYLVIPRLGVKARILAVGLNGDGSIGTPANVFDTAWYDKSSLPTQPGAMLIDGHISSWTSPGVFYNLAKLQPGDVIEVQRGDNQVFSYTVIKTVVYGSDNVDMEQVLNPINPAKPGLNLMSCYGSVISGTNEFNKRIVVYASAS